MGSLAVGPRVNALAPPRPATVAPNSNSGLLSGLASLFGGGAGGGNAVPMSYGPSPSAPTPFVNTAQQDPGIQAQLGRLNARLDNPEGSTRRAIDVATGAIRDANEGRRKAIKGMLASRGVLSSSSIPELTEAKLNRDEASQVNKSAEDIALGREQANDQMLLGATGAFTAAADSARADRSLGLSQYQMAEQARQAADRAAVDKWLGTINAITSLASL